MWREGLNMGSIGRRFYCGADPSKKGVIKGQMVKRGNVET